MEVELEKGFDYRLLYWSCALKAEINDAEKRLWENPALISVNPAYND